MVLPLNLILRWLSKNPERIAARKHYGNGLAETRTYDQDYRLTSITVPAIESWTLGYNADDNITGLTDNLNSGNNQTLGYDTLNRLNAGSGSYGSLSYQYDADGNRSSSTVNGITTSYTYGTANNRLTKVKPTGWSYDADGSLTKDGTFTYSYDDSERLSTVTKSGLTASYLYNGLAQRAEKTVNGTTTVFVYDEAGHLLGEYTPSGTLIAEHIWLNDRPIGVITPTGLYYVHTDQLDTPRYITNSSKQLVWEWQSDPFGTTAPNQNPSGLGTFTYNLRFPGQYYDAETGHDYNYFRDYDPSIGRYIESDPIGLAGGLNTYTYAGNDSLSSMDQLGLSYVYYSNGSLAVYTGSGNYIASFPAANNADSKSLGSIPPGWYPASGYNPHPEAANPDSAFGSYGIFYFNVPNRSYIGIHSGRVDKPDLLGRTGVNHATLGCIRTTDSAMKLLVYLMNHGDPLTAVGVAEHW